MSFFRRFSAAIAAAALSVAGSLASQVAKADGLTFAIYTPTEQSCLDVQNYSTQPGAIVQTFSCTGTSNQMWNAQVFGYGTDGSLSMHLVNVGSGLCLDLVYAGTNAGIGVLQAPCNSSASQTWKVAAPSKDVTRGGTVGNSYITYLDNQPVLFRNLINAVSGLCLQPNGGGQVTQQACGTNTTWRMPLF
jgi:hypothetical protein